MVLRLDDYLRRKIYIYYLVVTIMRNIMKKKNTFLESVGILGISMAIGFPTGMLVMQPIIHNDLQKKLVRLEKEKPVAAIELAKVVIESKGFIYQVVCYGAQKAARDYLESRK